MKGITVMHAVAAAQLAACGAAPEREVIVALVGDEEAGGDEGARWLLAPLGAMTAIGWGLIALWLSRHDAQFGGLRRPLQPRRCTRSRRGAAMSRSEAPTMTLALRIVWTASGGGWATGRPAVLGAGCVRCTMVVSVAECAMGG